MTCTYGKCSAADIVRAFEADGAQVSRAVATLLESRLIEREDVARRWRRKHLSANQQSRDVFESIQSLRQTYVQSILRDLSAEELQAFERMLRTIARRVDRQRGEEELEGDRPSESADSVRNPQR